MFLDLDPARRWDEGPSCMSCKRMIAGDEPTELVELPFDEQNKTHELNGIYHTDCARPYMSMIRALEMLKRWPR